MNPKGTREKKRGGGERFYSDNNLQTASSETKSVLGEDKRKVTLYKQFSHPQFPFWFLSCVSKLYSSDWFKSCPSGWLV